nr:uridine phosphorylase [Anaerolineae bacterium]
MTQPRKFVHSNFGGECFPGDIAPYVFLPTDAHQVEMLVGHWDTARRITHHYEYLIYTGTFRGTPVSACSTGLGGMSVAIAIEELAPLGAQTFLQLGLSSLPDTSSETGNLLIASGAVRFDGTSMDYVRPEYPAIAHFELVMAAAAAAEQLGFPYRIGIVSSMASSGAHIKTGLHRFLYDHTDSMRGTLNRVGVMGGSGEEATLFVQSTIYGLRAGSINGFPFGRDGENTWILTDLQELENRVMQAGLETMAVLAAWDQWKKRESVPYITPHLPES